MSDTNSNGPTSNNFPTKYRRRLLIIGAGPTALGAFHRFCQLKKQHLIEDDVEVLILERENEVGGLARSVTDAHGFTWDLGVHVMGISKYPDFVDALARCVPEWRTVPRCAMADMSHLIASDHESPGNTSECPQKTSFYVPYPVQNSIPYFPEKLKQKCLEELMANGDGNLEGAAAKGSQDFGEFSLALFGPTLQRIFIKPYNEKVWTVPIGEMGISWLQGRVPLTDRAELARRCALCPAKLAEEDGQRQTAFRYPAKCRGVGQMWHRFAKQLPASESILLGHRVVGIEPEARIVKVVRQLENKMENGEKEQEEKNATLDFHYDWLISTMPLTVLGKLSGLAPRLPLKYSTVILVGIGLNGGQSAFARQLSWAYYPRPEIIFYRCTVLSNFSLELVPQGGGPGCSSSAPAECPNPNGESNSQFWSVLCEIGQHSKVEMPAREAEQKALVDRVIEDLIRVGIVRSRVDCQSHWLKCLQFGYPIPTRNRDAVLAECHAKLETHQIYSRGRFGGWRYEISNQDHSFQIGLELVDRLFLGIPESLCAPP